MTHGRTFCSVERFEAVAQAVVDCSFVTSSLPVILSLEVGLVSTPQACLGAPLLPFSALVLVPLYDFRAPTFTLRQMHCAPKQQAYLASTLLMGLGQALLQVRSLPARHTTHTGRCIAE